MRLLTLNLRHGGGRRVAALLTHLLRHEADALVLTEHRHGPVSGQLRDGLLAAGYRHQVASHDGPRRNHVLIAAREPLQRVPLRTLRLDPVRLLPVRCAGLTLVAVHLPNLAAKLPHWEALLRVARRRRREPTVFMGDFNTGLVPADVQGGPFRFTGGAHMAALTGMGWVDAWRRLNPDGREYTWFSHRQRGFRLDHAFLSPACADGLRGATLDHAPREEGATDHSALIVDLAHPR